MAFAAFPASLVLDACTRAKNALLEQGLSSEQHYKETEYYKIETMAWAVCQTPPPGGARVFLTQDDFALLSKYYN